MSREGVPVTLDETIDYLLKLLGKAHLRDHFVLLQKSYPDTKEASQFFGSGILQSYWVQDRWLFKMLTGLASSRNFYEQPDIWSVLTGGSLTTPLYCLSVGRKNGRVQPKAYTHKEITYLLEHRQKLDLIFLPAHIAVEVMIYWILRPQRYVWNHRGRNTQTTL